MSEIGVGWDTPMVDCAECGKYTVDLARHLATRCTSTDPRRQENKPDFSELQWWRLLASKVDGLPRMGSPLTGEHYRLVRETP